MVTVSLQPFAFRKIILLVAAVIWLTSAVVFADPVFMNAHAREFSGRSPHTESAAAGAVKTRDTKSNEVVVARPHDLVRGELAPAAEAPPFSLSAEHFDPWNVATSRNSNLTFWPISLRL
jgi:hypothetical protein